MDSHPQILIDCVYLKVGVTSESEARVQGPAGQEDGLFAPLGYPQQQTVLNY